MIKPVVIIGAGPAGLSAAAELRLRGIESVMVVERESEPGGIPRHSHHQGFGVRDLHRPMSGPRYAERLTKHALALGVDLRLRSTAALDSSSSAVTLYAPTGIEHIDASAILLATGARERPRSARLVPGDRAPGTFTTGQLQQWVASGRSIGHRALVVGAEHVSYSAVLTLRHAGVRVVGLVTELPRSQSIVGVASLVHSALRVPTWTNTRVISVEGRNRVSRVVLEDLRNGERRTIDVDTIVFSADWIPDNELARRAGLAIDTGSHGPITDQFGRTSHAAIYAAGNLLHPVETADRCALGARRIADAIVRDLGLDPRPTHGVALRVTAPLAWAWPNRVIPNQLSETLVRLKAFTAQRRVVARQGGQIIGEAKLRHGSPGQHLSLDQSLLRGATAEGGVIDLSVEA